jgi:hypothetical protein
MFFLSCQTKKKDGAPHSVLAQFFFSVACRGPRPGSSRLPAAGFVRRSRGIVAAARAASVLLLPEESAASYCLDIDACTVSRSPRNTPVYFTRKRSKRNHVSASRWPQ